MMTTDREFQLWCALVAQFASDPRDTPDRATRFLAVLAGRPEFDPPVEGPPGAAT